MRIGGTLIVRNGNRLDYCWKEAALSLVPVCDEVIICDSESDDDTLDDALAIASKHSNVRVITFKWENPRNDLQWWLRWVNFARERLSTDYHLQLEADEVLHESSYPELRHLMESSFSMAGIVNRYNFWLDHRHLAPHGHFCSHLPIRLCPTAVFSPMDGITGHPRETEAGKIAVPTPKIELFHYNALRNFRAFGEKSKIVQEAFFGSCDPRINEESVTPNWMEKCQFPVPLLPFTGSHPAVAHAWLRSHGFEL